MKNMLLLAALLLIAAPLRAQGIRPAGSTPLNPQPATGLPAGPPPVSGTVTLDMSRQPAQDRKLKAVAPKARVKKPAPAGKQPAK